MVLFSSRLAVATTYYVSTTGHDDGPGTAAQPWATIGAAARTVRGGDTVVISGGVYREQVKIATASATVQDPITFRAAANEVVIIDATGRPYGIKINASHVVLDGMEVTNAAGFGISVLGSRRGISIRNCRIHHNATGGIRISSSQAARVEQCLIYRNGRHGIQVVGHDAGPVIKSCTIWGNALDGVQSRFSEVDLDDCIIAGNGGWGIDAHGGARVDYSDVWHNGEGDIAPRRRTAVGPTVLSVDPLFDDETNGDFHLASDSPAVGSGTNGGDMGYRYADRPPANDDGSEGFVAGSLTGWNLADPDVLLQTIYGTRQDARGAITANTAVALSLDKGVGIAFDVPRDTALDTLRIKLHNVKPQVGVRLRLYDVTDRGFVEGDATPARSDPGGSDNVAIFDSTYVTPASVPFHLEPLASPTARYTDLVVPLGPLEVLSGEYFLVIDNVGPSNTIGSMMVGDESEALAMGKRPDGRPLPGGVRVNAGPSMDNVRYYKLTSTEDATYTSATRSPAMQLTSTRVNHAPQVDAGDDQLVVLPETVVHLDGVAVDDAYPLPEMVTARWSQVSGPGTVRFDDTTAAQTTATFSTVGVYVLRLTATDSALVASDDVLIRWLPEVPPNQLPIVDAGSDQEIALPGSAVLQGTVSDDGEPDPPGMVETTWSRVSGPGTVEFDAPDVLHTRARFSAEGTYVLRITADDGQGSAFDELTVVVYPFGRYQGYGAGATGGAGGRVVTVTNLDDGGSGSFRDAVARLDGRPTIIQFAVGGEIFVSGEIRIGHNNVTVMGSSAPDPGITLNGEFSDRVLGIKASNVIVENLRIRNAGLENVLLWGGRDIVIDHCSITWSADGALDINGGVSHVTISRCLFAGAVEVSRSHGHRISWHYNLFTHNNRRQPKISTAGPDYNFICNYVRAWGNTAVNIQGSTHVNLINNYFGPPYPTEKWTAACYTSGTPAAEVYTAGNVHAADEPGSGIRGLYDVNRVGTASRAFQVERPPVPVTIIPASEVPADVIADVGALPPDAHDEAFIHTYNGRGREVGGPAP